MNVTFSFAALSNIGQLPTKVSFEDRKHQRVRLRPKHSVSGENPNNRIAQRQLDLAIDVSDTPPRCGR